LLSPKVCEKKAAKKWAVSPGIKEVLTQKKSEIASSMIKDEFFNLFASEQIPIFNGR
jgi:hypothetical protein